MDYDAIIIGGGAAGLFCAIEAGKRGRRVAVLEHNAEVGRKIIISGGGRCNFTNIHTKAENFISNNPHFCKSALAGYTPQNFVELVKKHKIEFYEKKLGQLFCRDSSRQIVEMLLVECRKAHVHIKTNCLVSGVSSRSVRVVVASEPRFAVETNCGKYYADHLVIACGGLSIPKIGVSDLGYRTAHQFGLKIVETRPSLVAMVMAGEKYGNLAGVSIDSQVFVGKQTFRENILFTHRTLSGPAVLQVSNYWRRNEPVTIDLLPEVNAAVLLESKCDSRQMLANCLGEILPKRFADAFTASKFANKPLNQLTARQVKEIGRILNGWQVSFVETAGYGRAEVTLGGVSTAELSSQTMEAKKVPGLYFIGEVVDVTGWLGGYNFQWAWASGFAAGNSI